MCGLFGWQVKHGDRRLTPLAAALMTQMVARGDDSWGYCQDGRVWKGLGEYPLNVPARSHRNALTLVAHTRSASVGPVSIPNAHPFHIGKIILAHNGGVSNWRDLNKEHKRDFEVDSMHIAAHIDEGRDVGELHGWGTVTWIREGEPHKVYVCKFNNGSFAAAKIYSGKEQLGIAWASTHDALIRSIGVAGFTSLRLVKVEDEIQY